MTRLTNAAVIVVTPDARATAAWYRDILGFRVVEHYDAEEAFAAAYRDSVEIVFVQATRGELQPNRVRHGAGFDVYLSPRPWKAWTSSAPRSHRWVATSSGSPR